MRYLQYNTLQRLGFGQFDAWASTFGETVTAVELAPEGTGYRARTRFSKFYKRLVNDLLPDNENSKAAACVENAFKIWENTMAQKSTQLIFCDLSTPKGDGTFNVYEDIRDRLVKKGVPEGEIAFIHMANTDAGKSELFAKVRSGQIRFLLGSTQKMGAGTNVQDRLIALHHLDVPWRPSEEERAGRYIGKSKIGHFVVQCMYICI